MQKQIDPAVIGRLNYRPDIDGLRAVAVLAVLVHHTFPSALRSGFVGVDVFFVLSGFLITSIITQEMENGTLSIAGFYERRVRRLLPAAALMVSTISIVAYFCFMPAGLKAYSESLAAYVLLSSNWYFATQQGYFDLGSQQMPLLHTWSLSVEEQFYLLYPFALLVVRGYWMRVGLLVALLGASMVFNRHTIEAGDPGAFFNSLGRFWELALGGLAALVAQRFSPGRLMAIAMRLAGLALIIYGLATITDQTNNYFRPLLAPTVGTALLLLAGARSDVISRTLAVEPVRYVGMISYGLYLWHWPILVIARMMVAELTPLQVAACLAIAFMAAALSFYLVEQPIRAKRWLPGKAPIFAVFGGISAVLVAGAATLVMTEGLPSRIPPQVQAMLDNADAFNPRFYPCFEAATNDPANSTLKRAQANDLCQIGTSHVPPSFIVWGDSHGYAALPAVDSAASKLGLSGLVALEAGCPPLVELNTLEKKDCAVLADTVLDLIQSREDIRTIVLIARWSYYALGVWDDPVGRIDGPDALSAVQVSLGRTLDRLRGREVVLMQEVPIHHSSVATAIGTRALFGRDADDLLVTRREYEAWRAPLASALRNKELTVLDPLPILCPGEICRAVEGGLPIYWDEDHLSQRGAILLEPLFMTALQSSVDPTR